MGEASEKKRIVSPTVTNSIRIPPGQVLTRKFPVYDIGPRAVFDEEKWRFVVGGDVREERMLTWGEFVNLPRIEVLSDFHCVTKWSKQNMLWEGVSTKTIYDLVEADSNARYLTVHCMEGYTTNLSIEDFLKDDCLFAYNLNGKTLDPEHGFPLRLVVPQLYAWKSAKYAYGVEFMLEDKPGYWEVRGYHIHGDPWKEERFWDDQMKVWEIRKKR